MSSVEGSLLAIFAGLFWPQDPTTQAAILLLLGVAMLAFGSVHVPLTLRLLQIGRLQRTVQACFEDETATKVQRQVVGNAFGDSPLAYQWQDFVRRWQNAIAADPVQNASLPELSRAPVRLAEVLEEHPIIPAGVRRSLLPALPALFLSAGLLGAFAALILALPGIGLSLDPLGSDPSSRSEQIAALVEHLEMALRVGLWGLLLSLAAALGGRLIEGRAEMLTETLDSWVQLVFGAISPGEMATRTAHEQRVAIGQLQEEVAELLRLASGRPRPLIRSTAPRPGSPPEAAPGEQAVERTARRAADLTAERVESAFGERVEALRAELATLRDSLGPQPAPTSGPSDEGADAVSAALEELTRRSESQGDASRDLSATARSVSDATEELRSGLDDFAGALAGVRESSGALTLSAERIGRGQAATDRAIGDLDASIAALAERLDQVLEARVGSRADERPASVPVPPASEAREPLAESPDASAGPYAEAAQQAPPAAPPAPSAEAHAEDEDEADRDDPPRVGSDDDTIPYMRAPTTEMVYAARDPGLAPPSAPGTGRGGNLSGLLRPTHHGPASPVPDPEDFDPQETTRFDSTERLTVAPASEAATGASDAGEATEDDEGNSTDAAPRRRGLFGRRK